MKKTTNKVVLVGTGAVGSSFLYSSINRGIAEEYILIDAFPQVAEGNALDLEDAISFQERPATTIKAGTYKDAKDADVIVITAGRPQKPGETRLEMVADNAKIMKSIATDIKKSGFKGITVIASNPVDVMTYTYAHVTGFEKSKIISSGTSLDSSRLKIDIAKKINVNASDVNAYVLGEHGDSSVMSMSGATVKGIPLKQFSDIYDFSSKKECDEMQTRVSRKAYEIIDRKRATFYGIGAALAQIVKAILRDEHKVIAVSPYLDGEYGVKDVFAGTPALIGADGVERILEFPMNATEKKQFTNSVKILKETIKVAMDAIK